MIVIGAIPLAMQVMRMFSSRPDMPARLGAGGLPGGGMPAGAMPPGGGPPGGGALFGILGMVGPYLIVISIILIVVGVILITHKNKVVRK